jgi:LysM repeat protein
VRAFLSLGRIGAGEHELVLKPENITLPPGLSVERIMPSAIAVELERILEKTVRVKADLAGPPPEGFELESVSVRPDMVRLRGPATVIGDITGLQTRSIDLQKLRPRQGDVVQDVPLTLASPSIQLPDMEKRQVQVTIRLHRIQETKTEEKAEEKPVRTHTVQKGDTLFEIGKRYGVSTEALRRLNGIGRGGHIEIGQELKLP